MVLNSAKDEKAKTNAGAQTLKIVEQSQYVPTLTALKKQYPELQIASEDVLFSISSRYWITQQQQGWIFACQAFAESNLVLTFAD